ncbi:hypothetical protein GCM10011519_05380 [Marmoricola endophyticus]|uniref:FHA domain-containing protein n=1 Tax=Marmoricola endophyticus TaxID=2040280 RepID=A0A917BDP2_9ACTN|nr:FHA domain-containing protein [Marmoricola endophyticus]GGF34845.1 hypothetical protein GCM10011519_05380 [Marmoricola endophyticus]
MPFCTQCGHENPDQARFCSQCGTRLESAAGSGESSVVDSSATITFGVGSGSASAEGGEERDRLAADDAAAVDGLPRNSALLVVQRGPGAGSRFLLDQDVVSAGRHPDSEIFLDDITVSRRHVEFRRGERGYSVVDVGSLNGTYVNRDRIEESDLSNGDEVQVGKFRLVYFSGGPTAG